MLNEDGLTVRVLHVDSRTRVSGRAEDCEIQLPESLNLPSGAVTWCTSASVPLAWPNVSTLNNKLYVTEYVDGLGLDCLLYTSPSPRDLSTSRMPSSA